MEKIIHKLINEFIEGVDTYTHNDSTWLIFTETKQWVIELTKEKTLWYNYNFFKSVFAYSSLNVVDNQQYITKWVEDNIINGVKRTMSETIPDSFLIEDTIQNGVKKTKMAHMKTDWSVNNTIENGVKETKSDDFNVSQFLCEEVIDKGVKETLRASYLNVDNVIQDGVKETKYNQSHQEPKFKEVLKNGVKETHREICEYKHTVDYIIQTGVKRTFNCDWPVPTDLIEGVINDGVKDTKVCNYTDPETQLMTIKWGHCIDEVIENGDKVCGTYVGGHRQEEKSESVIEYGKQI